jgi:hypothetical protein
MFAIAHENVLSGGSSALSATSLPTACAKIAGQVFTIDGGPVHASLRPTHLVIPPGLEETGRSLARLRMLDGADGNLVVVVENRISAAGVFDPTTSTESIVVGSDTLWFVAASANQRPAVAISYLEGSGVAPTIESFSLAGHGQWGSGWRVKLDVGVALTDWRSWVFSAGA